MPMLSLGSSLGTIAAPAHDPGNCPGYADGLKAFTHDPMLSLVMGIPILFMRAGGSPMAAGSQACASKSLPYHLGVATPAILALIGAYMLLKGK